MADWMASGGLVEAIVALTIAEWFVLSLYNRVTGRGISPGRSAAMLLPGLCLMLALRAALVGSGWQAIAAFLSAALVTHIADLALRWTR